MGACSRGAAKGAEVMDRMQRGLDETTGEIIDAAVKLHRRLGPGLRRIVNDLDPSASPRLRVNRR